MPRSARKDVTHGASVFLPAAVLTSHMRDLERSFSNRVTEIYNKADRRIQDLRQAKLEAIQQPAADVRKAARNWKLQVTKPAFQERLFRSYWPHVEHQLDQLEDSIQGLQLRQPPHWPLEELISPAPKKNPQPTPAQEQRRKNRIPAIFSLAESKISALEVGLKQAVDVQANKHERDAMAWRDKMLAKSAAYAKATPERIERVNQNLDIFEKSLASLSLSGHFRWPVVDIFHKKLVDYQETSLAVSSRHQNSRYPIPASQRNKYSQAPGFVIPTPDSIEWYASAPQSHYSNTPFAASILPTGKAPIVDFHPGLEMATSGKNASSAFDGPSQLYHGLSGTDTAWTVSPALPGAYGSFSDQHHPQQFWHANPPHYHFDANSSAAQPVYSPFEVQGSQDFLQPQPVFRQGDAAPRYQFEGGNAPSQQQHQGGGLGGHHDRSQMGENFQFQ
ncbi:hypothetical protein JCM10908_006618 [Rhodotorula pacifica]|uniref:uncharacterized protein n=1 Tax=Rhodotorula pacifica TaxID=1495444 RepID=UPI00316E30A3